MQQCLRTQEPWTRRSFLAGLGLSSAAALATPYAPRTSAHTLLHVATIDDQGSGALHTFVSDRRACKALGALPSERPVALATHPWLPILYVANDCSTWNNQPRSTIEAFFVDPHGQPLQLLARHSLALSAVAPRALAASADGHQLVVSSFGGGAWNAFSLNVQGVPAAHPAALKETGASQAEQNTAHPFGLLAHPSRSLLFGSDPGADRLSILRIDNDGLHAEYRLHVPPGSAPAHLAIEPRSGLLLASTTLRPALHTLKIDDAPSLALRDSTPLSTPITALAAHPSAGLVYSADAEHAVLTSWRVEPITGKLHPWHTLPLPVSSVTGLAIEGREALWLTAPEGVFKISLAPGTGRPHTPVLCSSLAGARTLLVQEFPR